MANTSLNFYRGKYSDYLKLVDDALVVSTNLYFTVPDDTAVEGDLKSSKFCLFHGTELLACSSNYEDVQKALADIVGLKGDLAALEERVGKISSELATYEIRQVVDDELTALGTNVKEAYALYKITPSVDENNDPTTIEEQVGDIVKIYKDSALQGVEMVDQKLQFTYLKADGETEVVSVDVSAFLAESEFGDGLVVSTDGVVSVNVAEDTTNEAGEVVAKNFLEFEDEEGNKSLAVRSIDTNATILQKDLKVAGLDAQFGAGNYNNNDVIPAGTDIYTILENILCKELYPLSSEIGYQSASASASMSNLILTLDTTGTTNNPVEVGTLVTMTAGKTNGTSATNVKDSVISNLTYGYAAEDNDTADSTATTITSTVTTAVSSNQYTIKATLSGFNADTTTNTQNVPSEVTGTGSASLEETVLGCCAEGSNTINIYASGATYSYEADAIPSGYTVSNLGKTDSAQTYNAISAVNKVTNVPTKSATTTVTAAYKYFVGYSSGTTVSDFDSAKIRALNAKSGWLTSTTSVLNANTTLTSNGQSIIIACPSTYSLTSITNGVGANILGNFTEKGTVNVQTGNINTTYMVYVYPITNGAKVEFKNLTIKK